MKETNANTFENDPFGLRKRDFSKRVPEKSEMFSREEALAYIHGCDFPESADDLLLAIEIAQRFPDFRNLHILDTMCGPGRLGRELFKIGAQKVTFHDGDPVMLDHARGKAWHEQRMGTFLGFTLSPVDNIPLQTDSFDLVVCHNSTHQLANENKLRNTIAEWIRITKPRGFIFIADYQRNTSPEFISALEERLTWTNPDIIPLLIPTFIASFSKKEFSRTVESVLGIQEFLVFDASLPELTPRMWERVNQDPFKGHVLDFSPISLRVIAQKGGI